jgi:redox-sensing transcriptional repressor
MAGIPEPTLERLARLYTTLSRLEEAGSAVTRLSSRELGELISVPDHTVRKDLSILKSFAEAEGGSPGTEQGYEADKLKTAIETRLGLAVPRSACLVGLGRLGVAVLHRQVWAERTYNLTAGFDASINRIELVKTEVPLFHSREIARVVREKGIQIGIITVSPGSAQDVAERLAEGGIKGIINFAPIVLALSGRDIIVRNISLAGELHALSAFLYMKGV